MCGRFVSSTPADQLAAYFGVEQLGETLLEPSYNVAPTNNVYAVFESDGKRALGAFRWGLVPFWAKDIRIGNKMINARAETIATRNAFRKPFQRQRCIIPADSFYEWTTLEGHAKKTPMRIHRVDDAVFAF
ncbi:MAG: SOS response-associated peptidase, partial [Acidimicrobiales bacterium]